MNEVHAVSPSLPARLTRRLRFLLVLVPASWAIGCGVSDYEARMGFTQQRMEYFDREVLYLGNPITPPPRRPDPPAEGQPENAPKPTGPEVDFFLQPPKNIAIKYDDAPEGTFLYRYAGAAGTTPGAPPTPQPPFTGMSANVSMFQELYVGAARSMTAEEAWAEIAKTLGNIDQSQIQKGVEKRGFDRAEPTRFEHAAFSVAVPAKISYYCYVNTSNAGTVAVVYSVLTDRATRPEIQDAMDLSIKSFAVGNELARVRSAYKPRSK